jgi:hypothetical protein
LCIHQTIRNRSPQDLQEQEQQPKLDVNQEFHCRVGNTEVCERNYGNRKRQAKMTMIHPQIWKWTRLKYRNNNKATEMNMTNKNVTATGLIQIPETSLRVLIIVS